MRPFLHWPAVARCEFHVVDVHLDGADVIDLARFLLGWTVQGTGVEFQFRGFGFARVIPVGEVDLFAGVRSKFFVLWNGEGNQS